MIKVTYLKGKNTGRSKALTTNPFLQLLFLSVLFVISARFNPPFSAHSTLFATGVAALLALPAVAYHFVKAAKAFFAMRSGVQSEEMMNDFFAARDYPENF